MNDPIWLAQRFEAERSHLRAVAYRLLGRLDEAEDAVQESWLRLSGTDASGIVNIGAWLMTVVARVCLDMLRVRHVRREESLEASVSPSISSREGEIDPEEEVELADTVGLALLVVLDALAPAERLAFVLHDIFAVPFDEIAPIVERTPAATRKLASRARSRVRGSSMVKDADVPTQRNVIEAFLAAAREGSFDALLAVLDPEMVVRADHAAVSWGMVKEARGEQALAGLARGAHHLLGSVPFAQAMLVDGAVGIAVAPRGWPLLLLRPSISDGKIIAIDVIADPAHLHQLPLAVFDD